MPVTYQARRWTWQSDEYSLFDRVSPLPPSFEKFWLHPWIKKTNVSTVDFTIERQRYLEYKVSLSLCLSTGLSSTTFYDHVQSLRECTQMGRPHNVVKEWKKSELLTRKVFHISHNSNKGSQIVEQIFLLCWLRMVNVWKMPLNKRDVKKWKCIWLSSLAACLISYSLKLRPFDSEGMGKYKVYTNSFSTWQLCFCMSLPKMEVVKLYCFRKIKKGQFSNKNSDC